MRTLLVKVGIGLAIFFGVAFVLYLMYRPSESVFSDRIGFRELKKRKYLPDGVVQKVTFEAKKTENSDETIIRKGVLVIRPEARATVLIAHGFMCNKNDITFLRSLFHNYSTMTFDFRAHGELKEGQCSSLGWNEKHEVIAAVKLIKQHPQLKDKPIIVYGFSMGAVASICAQAHEGNLFDAAILDCPFDSTHMIIARLVDRLTFRIAGYEFNMPGRSLLKKYAYNQYIQSVLKTALKAVAKMDSTAIETCIVPIDTVEQMGKITIPVYIIGCKEDKKAPIEAVRAVYDAAGGFKRLWITNGRCHFDSFFYNPEKYAYNVRRFIEQVLDNKISNKKQEKIIIDDDNEDEDEVIK